VGPQDKILAFRAEAVHGNLAGSAHIDAYGRARDRTPDVDGSLHGLGGDEPGQRIEARAEIVVFGIAVELPAIEARLRLVSRPGGPRSTGQSRGAGHGLCCHPPVSEQLEPRVQPAHAVERAGQFAVRVNHADGRLPENVAVHPHHSEESSLAFQRIAGRDGFPG